MTNYFFGKCGGKSQYVFYKRKDILFNGNFVFTITKNSLLNFDKYAVDRVVLRAKMLMTRK